MSFKVVRTIEKDHPTEPRLDQSVKLHDVWMPVRSFTYGLGDLGRLTWLLHTLRRAVAIPTVIVTKENENLEKRSAGSPLQPCLPGRRRPSWSEIHCPRSWRCTFAESHLLVSADPQCRIHCQGVSLSSNPGLPGEWFEMLVIIRKSSESEGEEETRCTGRLFRGRVVDVVCDVARECAPVYDESIGRGKKGP